MGKKKRKSAAANGDNKPPPGFFPRIEIRRIFDLTDGRLDGAVRQKLSADDELRIGRRPYFRAAAIHRALLTIEFEKRGSAKPASERRTNFLDLKRRAEYLEMIGVLVHVESVRPLLDAAADAVRKVGDQLGRKATVKGPDAQEAINNALLTVHESSREMSQREAEAMSQLGLLEGTN